MTTVYSRTLAQLIQSVAFGLDDCRLADCTSAGTTTSFISTDLTEADDYWNGAWARFYAGNNIGYHRRITDWVQSTFTATIGPALGAATTTTGKVQLHKLFQWLQYQDAVNRAILMGCDEYLLDKSETSITTMLADTYMYQIPEGIRYITRVAVEDTAGSDTFKWSAEIDRRLYRVYHLESPYIEFDERYWGPDVGKKLMIDGFGIQGTLSLDTDVCRLPPEFIIQKAKALLLEQKPERWKEADRAHALANEERRRMIIPVPANALSVFEP